MTIGYGTVRTNEMKHRQGGRLDIASETGARQAQSERTDFIPEEEYGHSRRPVARAESDRGDKDSSAGEESVNRTDSRPETRVALDDGRGDASAAAKSAENGQAVRDSDGDTMWDDEDNCPSTPNRDQYDEDRDAKGAACDPDDNRGPG